MRRFVRRAGVVAACAALWCAGSTGAAASGDGAGPEFVAASYEEAHDGTNGGTSWVYADVADDGWFDLGTEVDNPVSVGGGYASARAIAEHRIEVTLAPGRYRAVAVLTGLNGWAAADRVAQASATSNVSVECSSCVVHEMTGATIAHSVPAFAAGTVSDGTATTTVTFTLSQAETVALPVLTAAQAEAGVYLRTAVGGGEAGAELTGSVDSVTVAPA